MRILVYLLSIVAIISLNSCDLPIGSNLDFKNNSDNSISILTPLYPGTSVVSKPDTTLHWCINPTSRKIRPNETICCAQLHHYQFDYVFDNLGVDTLSVFIFNSRTLDSLPWDSIRDKYILLQRYDLSVFDANEMDLLIFPPDTTMKHIHMWPPYGTYDKCGRIKRKQSLP